MPGEALAACRAAITQHSKSFALASRLLPASVREDTFVLYAWCRRADDAIDRVASKERHATWMRLVRELDAVYGDRRPQDPVLEAFQGVVRRCSVPRSYPEALLVGMRMDVDRRRYDSLDELLEYCFCVAGTVGLMMCHVMRVRGDSALEHAADLGIAMQLTNIARDVLEDWGIGRLYLPTTMLAAEGVPHLPSALGGPFPERARGPVARITRRLLAEAERYYRSADMGVEVLGARCAVAVRSARSIYAAIGSRVERQGGDPLAGRAVVPTADKLRRVVSALACESAARARRTRGHSTPLRIPEAVHPLAESARFRLDQVEQLPDGLHAGELLVAEPDA